MASKKKTKKHKTPPSLKLSDAELRQLFQSAVNAHRQGKIEMAEESYRTILANLPEHEGALNLLGVITMQKGNWGAAKKLIEKAIKAKPDYAEAYCNMGILLSNIENLEEAEKYFEKAIETTPGYARAHCNLAHVYRKKSLWKEAIENYEKAAKYEPRLAEAWEALLDLKPLEGGDPLISILERNMEKFPHDIPLFHYILGKAYDSAGKFEQALTSFKKANELEKRTPGRQMTPQEHEKYIDLLIENFAKDCFMKRKSWGNENAPVFLIGMPCSGQDSIAKIISLHPQLQLSNSRRLGIIAQKIIEKSNSNPQEAFDSLNENIIKSAVEKYLKAFEKATNGTIIFDYSPLNIFNLWLANLMFPNARIVFCERDPVDTCLACHFSGSHPLRKYSLAETGRFYKAYKKLEDHWKNALTMPFIKVEYQDITGKPEDTAKKIISFCGMKWPDKRADIPVLQANLEMRKKYPELALEIDEALKADG